MTSTRTTTRGLRADTPIRPVRIARRRVLLGATAALGVALLLGGCSTPAQERGPDPSTSGASSTTSDSAASDSAASEGIPTEQASDACVEAVPASQAGAGAGASALPEGWPEPPAGSELCLSSTGLGADPTHSFSYASPLSAEDTLRHYETALAAFVPQRTPAPTGGDMLEGSAHGVDFQLQPAEGGFVLVTRTTG